MTAVWEAVQQGNLDVCKEMNVKYREREQQREAETIVREGSSTDLYTSLGKRGYKDTATLYKNMPYHSILNLAALWAARS